MPNAAVVADARRHFEIWGVDDLLAAGAVEVEPSTGPHALRHACACPLIAAGESVKVLSERLGRTNAAMTLNVCSHLRPESEDHARGR